jgi:hydrogenase expression/formation protein HypC
MKLVQVDGAKGIARIRAVRQEVDLSLIDNPRIGDYVIVHAGFAIEKVDTRRADTMIADISEMVRKTKKP